MATREVCQMQAIHGCICAASRGICSPQDYSETESTSLSLEAGACVLGDDGISASSAASVRLCGVSVALLRGVVTEQTQPLDSQLYSRHFVSN